MIENKVASLEDRIQLIKTELQSDEHQLLNLDDKAMHLLELCVQQAFVRMQREDEK